MKSLVESIIGKRGGKYSQIAPKLEKVLSDDNAIEELAKNHNVSFESMKDLFNKVKDTVRKVADMDISDEDRARWLDDFLENDAANEYLSDEDLDKMAKEINRNRGTLDEIIEDVSRWMFKQIR